MPVNFRSSLALPIAFGLVGALLLMATPVSAELAKWDQERVTTISQTLSKACSVLYNTSYKDPWIGGESPAGGPNNKANFMDRIRLLRQECNHIAKSLSKGASRSATLGAYKRIGELKRDIEVLGSELFLDDYETAKLDAVEDAYRQLTPYYDPDWDAKSTKNEKK